MSNWLNGRHPDKHDSFFGIDFQKSEPHLAGAQINCSGSITREMFLEALERILTAAPTPPCGFKESPHLVQPRPIGKMVICVHCGCSGVRVSETEMRPLNDEGLKTGVAAMRGGLKRIRRVKGKDRRL